MTTPGVTADVVIVGNGPVGATLANLLGVAGWSVAIIERFVDCYTLPRATHLDGEAMRAMQATGLAEEFAATLGVHPRMRFVNGEGRLLADWPRPTAHPRRPASRRDGRSPEPDRRRRRAMARGVRNDW